MTDFTQKLTEALMEYSRTCEQDVQQIIDDVSKEAKKRLSATAPKRTGKYKRGFRVTITKRSGYYKADIHNPKKYMLTHLLEKGHKVRGGRSPALPHFAAVEQWANKEVERRIREALSK